jgi:hypothetical protein
MSEQCLCYKCRKPAEVHGSRWCASCWYPSIDEDWQRYKYLVEEGYTRYQAKIMAGLADPDED